MIHLFEAKIQEKNLELVKEYDSGIPAILLGDSTRLHQILINLLGNAASANLCASAVNRGKGQPTLMATISTLDPMWFYCNVSEVEYIRAETKSRKSGREIATLPLTLELSDGTVRPDVGKFVFIDRAVNAKTGTLRIRAEFSNKDKLLRPGMFARVRVDLGVQKDSILVPERALVELQGRSFVWVVTKEGKASQRSVKLGDQVGSDFVVIEGVQAGEHVIVEGLQKAREGAPVNAMTAAQIAAMTPAAAPAEKPAKE